MPSCCNRIATRVHLLISKCACDHNVNYFPQLLAKFANNLPTSIARIFNCNLQVLLTHEEADEHDAQQDLRPGSRPEGDPEFVRRTERVLDKARREHYY